MLVLLLCIVMKLLELSSGRFINANNNLNLNNNINKSNNANVNNQANRLRVRQRRKRLCLRGLQRSGPRGGMSEELTHSPGSDCNSNLTNNEKCGGESTASYISNASSSQDVDFIQDNSDYQWFLDYGYRDGSSTAHHQHTSVLPSLSTSYEIGYYNDLAKNLDANLAEVDMEDFRSEDIHSILNTLPTMCCGEIQSEHEGEMFASVSGSMMAKFDFDSSLSPHTSSQGEESAGSMSICKSELLFSPVRECPLPSTNFSVDSLDCELLDEHDILLTCQANKDNYTIAFEGSTALYSEDSQYNDTGESEGTASASTSENNNWSSRRMTRSKIHASGCRALDTSMARSDSVYTTWSKLKKRSSEVQLVRHPSGNNNTCADSHGFGQMVGDVSAVKSQSLPNLYRRRWRCRLACGTSKTSNMSSSVESEPRLRVSNNLMKLYDVQNRGSGSILSEANSSIDGGISSSSGNSKKQNFSLVKLFMKQKSASNEGMCIGTDHSSTSECWPASANSQSEGDSDSYALETMKQRSLTNTSCNDISRDDSRNENEPCLCLNDYKCSLHNTENTCNDNKTARHRYINAEYENGNEDERGYKTCSDSSMNHWIKNNENTGDYSACFEDSLVEPSKRDDIYSQHANDLIEEEDEEQESERSESVEQLTESFSKIEESTLDLGGTSCGSDQHDSCSNSSHCSVNKCCERKSNLINVPKKIRQFNVNNNNSIEQDDSQSTGRQKCIKKECCSTQTKKSDYSKNTSSQSSCSISSADDKDSTLHSHGSIKTRNRTSSPFSCICISKTKHSSTQIPVHLMNRSIQTSGFADINMLKSSPFRLLDSPNGTSLVKILEPSYKIGKLGDEKRPVYVFYPNYALPDLTFLSEKKKDLDPSKIVLMPQKFASPKNQKDNNQQDQGKPTRRMPCFHKPHRPFSCTDVENLRKKGFSHVKDWESLTFLLPQEYRHILADVPEIVHHFKGKEEHLKPLFCVSPPLRKMKPRPLSCDCGSFVIASEPKTMASTGQNGTNVSSSSSTATQPSSGYRGSSTMLLTDSASNHPNPTSYNPLFVYRYDSVSSESSLMVNPQLGDKKQPPALPKRSVSLSSNEDCKVKCSSENQDIPPRPPLPKGILRKSLDNNPHYRCRLRKNSGSGKRYSMFELGRDNSNEDISLQYKRNSLQNMDYVSILGKDIPENIRRINMENQHGGKIKEQYLPEKDINEAEDDDFNDEGVYAGTDSSFEEGVHDYNEARPPTPPVPKTPDTEDHFCTKSDGNKTDEEDEVLRLEEFLHLSGLSSICSGEGVGDWDQADMMKLRQQVSRFLSNKQNISDCINLAVPNNTPEHKGLCDCRGKKSVSFADKVCIHMRDKNTHLSSTASTATSPQSYQTKLNPTLSDLPICEEIEGSCDRISNSSAEITRISTCSQPEALTNSSTLQVSRKRGLVTAVGDAVEQVICHFSAARNQSHCSLLGDSSQTPACAHLILSTLCPALYAVLSDGLKPNIETAFGPIDNSVWQVVEASAQQGPMTKSLNELVLKINNEDVLSEGLMKFNAFVFGLLNVRSLDAWVGYLRTRESVLRKHYLNDGFLPLSNTSGAAMHALADQVLASLQPLSLLPFKLDLLFECRQIHRSFKRMDSFQQPETTQNNTSPQQANSKQWGLMKLVRSIQNSIIQSTDDDCQAIWQQRKQFAKALDENEETEYQSNCKASVEPPLPDLLDSSVNNRVSRAEDKPRPRSCVDASSGAAPGGFSLMNDIASTVKKRWSGIHLGSKLFQAFDRLGTEDTEEEYTDSLETTPKMNNNRKNKTPDNNSQNVNTKQRTKCRSASLEDSTSSSEEKDGGREYESEGEINKCDESPVQEHKPRFNGGGKFRRLQMKWEMLSGKESSGSEKASPCTPSPGSSNGSITGSRSRIPRPVTSPVRTSGIPVFSSNLPNKTMGRKVPTNTSVLPTSNPETRRLTHTVGKYKTNDMEAPVHVSKTVPRSQTSNIRPPMVKRQSTVTTRCSRVDQQQAENKPVRPSSLPYRTPSTTAGSRATTTTSKSEPQRRAASSSLNRQKKNVEEPVSQRWVRTLCHRLPSDSGHLSFNEGEKLKVVLDVDNKWMLCCRGDQKGLVPRSAVIAVQDYPLRF